MATRRAGGRLHFLQRRGGAPAGCPDPRVVARRAAERFVSSPPAQGPAVRDPHSGAVCCHVGSITNITERKRADDEIRQLNASLERRVAERTAELAAITVRLQRAAQTATAEFKPNFDSALPLEKALGLTPRVAETLLWIAQGKTNGDIGTILGISEATVKKHVLEIFATLSVETRTAAGLRALEILSSPAAHPRCPDAG